MSSSSTAALTAATKMVRAQIVAVPIDQLIGQPTQQSVCHLIDQLAAFASHFSTTKWSGHHGYLALVLSADKMKLITNDANLNCSRLLLPARINPAITDTTTGRQLLQLQDDQKLEWQDYTFQQVIDEIGVQAIVGAVDAQYFDKLAEDYIGYKNHTIATMLAQLWTWFLITTQEKKGVKARF